MVLIKKLKKKKVFSQIKKKKKTMRKNSNYFVGNEAFSNSRVQQDRTQRTMIQLSL